MAKRAPRAASPPEGLVHVPGFLSPEEEAELLPRLEALPLAEIRMHGVVAKRRAAHFGFDYGYDRREIAPAPPMPPFLDGVRTRLAALAGVEPASLEEILVTCYPKGAGIGWHRDAPMFGVVAVVSLGSPCLFRFRRDVPSGRERWDLALGARDAYVLQGPARKEWQHGIDAVPDVRWSISFRTVHAGWKARAERKDERRPIV